MSGIVLKLRREIEHLTDELAKVNAAIKGCESLAGRFLDRVTSERDQAVADRRRLWKALQAEMEMPSGYEPVSQRRARIRRILKEVQP